MAMINCPECNKQISDSAQSCPNCGKPLSHADIETAKTKSNNMAMGCMTVIGLVVALIFLAPMCSKPSSDTTAATRSATVENSSWDGSVRQVKRWLESNAKDPSSIEYIEWSPVQKLGDIYIVRVKYRGKNSFGGMTVENELFRLDSSGNVVSHSPWNGD